ncbi:MAG: hypothetical protein D6E12_01815, partial [Desulfovibrio sp.]
MLSGFLCVVLLFFLPLAWGCRHQAVGPDWDKAFYTDLTSASLDRAQLELVAQEAFDDAPILSAWLRITLPYNQTMFPRNVASPLFTWDNDDSDSWLVCVLPESGAPVVVRVGETRWVPGAETWEGIKAASLDTPARIVILGLNSQGLAHSVGEIEIVTSAEQVAWPIMWQEMPLPFTFGREHPESFTWRLGDVASYDEPRTVLTDQEVCGMCHSFSLNGEAFGLDLDVDGDKGAFLLSRVEDGLNLTRDNLFSWTDFQNDGQVTLGLFARISPDAGYVAATIREKSMLVTFDDPMYSEFFFPMRGVLAFFRSDLSRFSYLPGADDAAYIHAGPGWSPDGKYLAFSRAPVTEEYLPVMEGRGSFPAAPGEDIHDLNARYPMRFDIYRIPFNGGAGGEAVPIPGASDNGRSNYWPRYSPDGKWLVYTQADNAMMNQPNSDLHIIPAEGGESRRLACSRDSHNS